MPICTIHLLALTSTTTLQHFLTTLTTSNLQPLTIARVLRWIILPSSISISTLLAPNTNWDILLILPSPAPLPPTIQSLVAQQFTLHAGVPSRLVRNYADKNQRLLYPDPDDIPPLTGALEKVRVTISAQALELSDELRTWVDGFAQREGGGGPVSMLNLLAFRPGLKGEYLKYGAEFARTVGVRRGGEAKIVGSVIHGESGGGEDGDRDGKAKQAGIEKDDGEGWDEMALAHYPSILHFADMLASEDYQAVNQKYRVGSLKDTLILCTSEVGFGESLDAGGSDEGGAVGASRIQSGGRERTRKETGGGAKL